MALTARPNMERVISGSKPPLLYHWRVLCKFSAITKENSLWKQIVGCIHFEKQLLKKKGNLNLFDALQSLFSALKDINYEQTEFLILKSCLNFCKPNHLLRTTPPISSGEGLAHFDLHLRVAIERL